MKPILAEPALFSLSLALMILLIVGVCVVAGFVFLLYYFGRGKDLKTTPPVQPPPVASTTKVLHRQCPQCGVVLQPDVPEGLCPSCLLQRGMGTEGGAPPGSPPFVPPTIPDLAKLFPQLEILELIGKGGMGAVYKARQPALDRFVALKILAPRSGGDLDFAGRFTREARALARLSHPNIVGVYDFGEKSGHRPDATPLHYFIMEFVDGPNLRQAGKLSPREAMEIIPQICAALQFAHDEGIVHRDIKPENVLLDKKGRVKIADFGLAKILGQEPAAMRLTGAKDIMGTPHYMAPEQVERPQDVDHRADIYSLGVVFYEMLTGELPLGKFQSPSQKVRVDVRLDEVVLRSLAKEPELRYQHVSEMGTRVETIAHTEGTTEAARATPQFYPTGWEYRSTKTLWGWPLLHVTEGMDPKTGKVYVSRGIFAIGGIARGLFAFGGRAYGGFAFGGIAAGLFAFGGVAVGGIAVGGVALGLLLALGGLAVGMATLGSPGFGFCRVQEMMPFLSILHFAPAFVVLLLVSILVPLIVQSWAKTQVQKNSGPRGTPPAFRDEGVGSKSLRRGLKVAAWTSFACLLATVVVTFLLPKDYVATALVRLTGPAAEDPYHLQTEVEVIQSVPVLEKAVASAKFEEHGGKRSFGDQSDATLVLMKRQVEVQPVRNTALVQIRFHSDSPAWSAEVANKIAEAYCAGLSAHRGEIIDRAVAPLHPARPNVPLNIFIGAVTGAVIGLLAGLAAGLFAFLWHGSARAGAPAADHFWRRFAVVMACVVLTPVAISIFGILAAMAIPAFVKARNQAQAIHEKQITSKSPLVRSDYIGKAWFPKGDSIEILSVERTEERMSVRGRYLLASADEASLALHITSTNDTVVPEDPTQTKKISKGRGEFELSRSHLVPGLPHVSMYANGGSFAGVYFGTEAEALQESQLDLGPTNALPASAETWSPLLVAGEKPDLQKMLQDATKLREVGHFEESLQHHLWYHTHALEYDPGQTGVRLSFALSDWIELGRRYPRAKQALIEIRDRDVQALTNGTGTFNLFMDVSSINGYLAEGDATRRLFEKIEERDPTLAKQTFGLVEGVLVQHGDYEKCLKYIGDPFAAFESLRAARERMKQFEAQNAARREAQTQRLQALAKTNSLYPNIPVPFLSAPPKFADNNFVGQTRQLIEILVATDHQADAEKIRDQAVAILDDARLKSAVSDAEQKIAGRAGKK